MSDGYYMVYRMGLKEICGEAVVSQFDRDAYTIYAFE